MDLNLVAVIKISDSVESMGLDSGFYLSKLPNRLVSRLRNWKYGEYGWTSPVNLLMTACWYKHLHYSQDVCKIWAEDSSGRGIPGGFSIRTFDESVTVKVINRLEIAANFCSGNSGMQGSRAIEKMRDAGRISRTTQLKQRVLFDIDLFSNILNDINELDRESAKLCFQFFISKGLEIKLLRQSQASSLYTVKKSNPCKIYSLLVNSCKTIQDPEFVRAVAASLIFSKHKGDYLNAVMHGLAGHKTAANTQSNDPGDIWLSVNGRPIIAAEVKDSSYRFGHTHISNARNRSAVNHTVQLYYLVTASDYPIESDALEDQRLFERFDHSAESGLFIIATTIRDLAQETLFKAEDKVLVVSTINSFLQVMPSLKVSTLSKWKDMVDKCQ
jgi:hypothetical protein